jgi:hypothetical protein
MLPRQVGSDDLLVSCRPGRDGSRHFDRDYRFRSIYEQLRSPSSPGLHEPLQCTSPRYPARSCGADPQWQWPQARYPGAYPEGQLRTLQRRLKMLRGELAHRLIFATSSEATTLLSDLPGV